MFGYFWHRIPFFRFLIPLISGILAGFNTSYSPIYIVVFSAIIFSLILVQVFLKSLHIKSFLHGLSIFIIFLFLGFLISQQFLNQQSDAIRNFNSENYVLKIVGLPSLKPKKIKCIAEIYQPNDFQLQKSSISQCLVLFDTICYRTVKAGDCFYISKESLKDINPALNPGDFDYKNYLFLKGIYKQVDFTHHQVNSFYYQEPSFPENYSVLSQLFIRKTLQNYLPESEIRSIALALLYGYDDEISKELSNQYAVTGTLHVLAVSGMHVGLVFIFLDFLLVFLEKNKLLKLVKAILVLCFIWFYSLLCGLSPSILRAAVMISFFVVSKLLERVYNPVNTLSASAFFMLLFNPALLFDAGFQLSYFAVLGLSLFYQSIYLWYEPKSWLADQIWKLLAASTAAQVTTFPLSLYYFHQFPILFPITNLLIIPLSTFAIYAGIALLAFSPIQFIAKYIALVLKQLILLSNLVASFLSKLPFCAIDGIYISISQSLLLFAITLFLLAFVYQKHLWQLKAFLYSILFFVLLTTISFISNTNRSFVRIYAYRNQTCLLLVNNGSVTLFADSSFITKNKTINLIQPEFIEPISFVNTQNKAFSLEIYDYVFANHPFYFQNKNLGNKKAYFLKTSPKINISDTNNCITLNLSVDSGQKTKIQFDENRENLLLKSGAFEVLL
jgi:competence protein ComEC